MTTRPKRDLDAAFARTLAPPAERIARAERDAQGGRCVREKYSMPAEDLEVLRALHLRALRLGINASRSGIVRAGVHAIAALGDEDLRAALAEGEPGARLRPGPRRPA